MRIRARLDALEHGPYGIAAFALAAAALAAGAAAGMCIYAGYGELAHRLIHPHWIWIPVALGAEVVAYAGYVLAYRGVACAEGGATLELKHAAALVAAGFGAFVPGGGFALDGPALERAGLSKRDARERVFAIAVLEWFVLAPAAVVAAAFALVRDGVALDLTLPWLVGVPVGGLVALTLLVRSRSWSARTGWKGRLRGALDALALVLRMSIHPREHGGAFVGIVLYWLGDIACLWAMLHVVFAAPPPTAQLVLGYATGYALTRRTLPLGGAGLVEALLPLSLGWVGIALAPAVLAVIGYRFMNLWLPMIPALAGLPSLRRLGRRRVRMA